LNTTCPDGGGTCAAPGAPFLEFERLEFERHTLRATSEQQRVIRVMQNHGSVLLWLVCGGQCGAKREPCLIERLLGAQSTHVVVKVAPEHEDIRIAL
jgi:hypothetical protein